MAGIVKTKDLMIEVARQLFASVGFTNTTMNDIADASKKGRRTLYTYFRNKDEIFHAVIERELERLWHDIELTLRLPASPEDKILTVMLTLVLRNGSLRAEFFRDIWLVEKARADFDRQEITRLEALLHEGKAQGIFAIEDIRLTAYILQNITKGMEVPYISGAYRAEGTITEIRKVVRHLLLYGLTSPAPTEQGVSPTPLP